LKDFELHLLHSQVTKRRRNSELPPPLNDKVDAEVGGLHNLPL